VIAVLASAGLLEGGRTVVTADGQEIAIARVDGQVHAIANTCPHRGGSLGDGDLTGHHLYCPQHAWCFDVRTGAGFFPTGARVATHKVEERGGQIFVDPVPQPLPIDFVPPVF
jgi:nitrite reductase (NADH) small subunit